MGHDQIKKIKKSVALKKIFMWTVLCLASYTICGFFVLPPVIKFISIKKLSENLKRQVTIHDIKINPFKLSITIKGFAVRETDGSGVFASFNRLYLNIQGVSAFKLGVIVKELQIERPYVRLIRKDNEQYNFSDLLAKKGSESREQSGPVKFSISNIRISNAHADFSDTPKNKTHSITDLHVSIPFLSNFHHQIKIDVLPSFRGKINNTPIFIQGRTRPFDESLETSFNINLQDINIPYYLSYLPFKRNFEMVSGFLDAKIKIYYKKGKNSRTPTLTLAGGMTLKKVALENKDGRPLLALPGLDILIAPSGLLSGQVNLIKVLAHNPELHLGRDRSGIINIRPFIHEEGRNKVVPEKVAPKKAKIINARNISITGGKVFFSDLSFVEPFNTVLDPIDLNINDFSNGPGRKARYKLSIRTDAGEQIQFAGDFSLDPFQSEGQIDFKDIVVKRYSPYYEDYILFDIIDSVLRFKTDYSYAKHKGQTEAGLSNLNLLLSSVKLKKRGEDKDFLSIPVVSIKETRVDIQKREIEIGELFTEKGQVDLRRAKNGDLNLLTLVSGRPDHGRSEVLDKVEIKERPFQVTLKKILVEQYAIGMEDLVPPQPVRIALKEINLQVKEFSTKKDKKAEISFSFHLGKKGRFSARGPVGIDPIFADLKLGLKEINIRPFEPYFSDKLNIIVNDGGISTAGRLVAGYLAGDEINVSFKGEASLNNFSSLDRVNGEDFLRWRSFYLSDIDFSSSPFHLDIAKIAVTDFYSSLIVNTDGTLNIQDILKDEDVKTKSPVSTPSQEEESDVEKDAGITERIRVGMVTLQGGRIHFVDKHIKPNYSAMLSEIGGRVSALSSKETKPADVSLMGKLDKYGPLEITGKINPLKEDLFVDLKIKLKHVELSSMTPYSGKYVGYTIEKGKLYLDLKYRLAGKKLDAENKVFLDQFTFGDRVESPHATNLPVNFAIALLKNRKGEINLDIPLRGNIGDPDFSLGRIIIKMLVNLIMKAVTSPFALLQAIVGVGDDFSFLEFDYGSHIIDEHSLKKIDALVKALHERPSLILEIKGHVDMEKDWEGLRQNFLKKKLRSQKLRIMIEKGLPAVPIDDITIDPGEYQTYLELAYRAAKFPKPRNITGLEKKLPQNEMEKLMLTNIDIKDADLRLLAFRRAENIKEYILRSGSIDPGRLFITEPKSLSPEKQKKLKKSRVDFKLK